MKNRWIALALCICGCFFGFHYWYLGNWKKWLLFFCTAGGCGIWWVCDIFILATDSRYIEKYEEKKEEDKKRKEEFKALEVKNRIIKEEQKVQLNRENGGPVACCPKCNSTSITAQKKGFGLAKGAAGIFTLGAYGVLAAGIGKNKIIITCLSCGKQFKPGR